jgi:hypothetical protein
VSFRRSTIAVLTAALAVAAVTVVMRATTAESAAGDPTSTVTTEAPVTTPPATAAPTTTESATTTTVPRPPTPAAAMVVARDSVPSAGWFHVTGKPVPLGTAMLRYRNVNRLIQTGDTYHPAGPLSLWFRAPGPPGSRITIRVEALNRWGSVIGTIGTVTLTTGNAMLPLPRNTGSGKRMVVHSDAQQVWLVEADGSVRDTFLMSGRRLRTASGFDQPGLFTVYSKSTTMRYCAGRCGTANHMVRYQRTTVSSVGSHSLPSEGGQLVQGVEDLGWPLSHGCTRLEASKAKAVYAFARIGTLVVVL